VGLFVILLLPSLVASTSQKMSLTNSEKSIAIFSLILFFYTSILSIAFVLIIITSLFLLLTIGNNQKYNNGFTSVRQVPLAILINTFATFTIFESSTFFHLFILLEVFLVISLIFISGENNIEQHALLYLIPNLILGLVWLLGTIVLLLSFGTVNLLELTLLCTYLPTDYEIFLVFPCLLFSIVILNKLMSFPFNLLLPQIYNCLSTPSLVFFSLSFLMPYYTILVMLLSFVNIVLPPLLFCLAGFSVVVSGLIICFCSVISSFLAHLTSLNNNMAVLLLVGLNSVDALFIFYFFLLTYLISVFPFYYQISSLNMNTSFYSFFEKTHRHNISFFFFMLLVLLFISGFPGAVLFVGKFGVINRLFGTLAMVFFYWFYLLVTFTLFLSLFALSLTVIEQLNSNGVGEVGLLQEQSQMSRYFGDFLPRSYGEFVAVYYGATSFFWLVLLFF